MGKTRYEDLTETGSILIIENSSIATKLRTKTEEENMIITSTGFMLKDLIHSVSY